MQKPRYVLFGSIVLLAATVMPCDRISAGQVSAAVAPAGIGVHMVSGWPVARLRLGRSRLRRGWSAPSGARSGPSEVQSPASYSKGSLPPQKSNKLTSLGRSIFWLFRFGSLGGVLCFLVALVFGLLKLRERFG